MDREQPLSARAAMREREGREMSAFVMPGTLLSRCRRPVPTLSQNCDAASSGPGGSGMGSAAVMRP